MRRAIIGFIAGMVTMLIVLGGARQMVIARVADDLSYRFDHYVFDLPQFPTGDFQFGRLVRRALCPATATVTFYDAHYRPVTQPDTPGRYGAVVRMNVCGQIAYRYITLYKTPDQPYWADRPWPITAEVPPGSGLDPVVVRNQSAQIAEQLRTTFVNDGGTTPDQAILLAGLSETLPSEPPAVKRTNAAARDEAWWYGLRKKLGLETHYHYILKLPRDYDADATKRWPLMLYLSAGQERGSDLALLRKGGLPLETETGREIPAIVLSPQCPITEAWSVEALAQMIDDFSAKYRIDPDRIYLLGGTETWFLALAYPERFAGIIPIGGENDPGDAARLKDLPIWAFQGINEDLHATTRTTDMLDAIAHAGGSSHLTFSDGRHDVWDQAFATDAVYTWLLAQKRGQPEAATPGISALYVPPVKPATAFEP